VALSFASSPEQPTTQTPKLPQVLLRPQLPFFPVKAEHLEREREREGGGGGGGRGVCVFVFVGCECDCILIELAGGRKW